VWQRREVCEGKIMVLQRATQFPVADPGLDGHRRLTYLDDLVEILRRQQCADRVADKVERVPRTKRPDRFDTRDHLLRLLH